MHYYDDRATREFVKMDADDWDFWRGLMGTGVSFRAGIFIQVGREFLLVRGVDSRVSNSGDSTKREMIRSGRGITRSIRGKWGPPKGCSGSDEKYVWQTALREVEEETGIRLSRDRVKGKTLSMYVRHTGEKITSIYLFYHVILSARPRVQIQPSEITTYGWYSIDNVPRPMTIAMAHYANMMGGVDGSSA